MSDRDVGRTPAGVLRALGHRRAAAPTEDTPRWHLVAAEEASAAGRWDEAREALDRARANLNGDPLDTSEAAFVGLRMCVARLDILAATAELTDLVSLHDPADPVWNRRARGIIGEAPKAAGADLLLKLLPALPDETERGADVKRILPGPTETMPVLPGEAEWLEEARSGVSPRRLSGGQDTDDPLGAESSGDHQPEGPRRGIPDFQARQPQTPPDRDEKVSTEDPPPPPLTANASPLPPIPVQNPFTAAERARDAARNAAGEDRVGADSAPEPEVGDTPQQVMSRGWTDPQQPQDHELPAASDESVELFVLGDVETGAEPPAFTGRLFVAGTDVDLSDADGLRDRLVAAMLEGAVTDREGDELFHTASTFLNNFDYATAEALFSAAMQVPHLRVAGCEGLMQCLVKLGRLADAVTTAGLAVRLFSEDGPAVLGIVYWQGVAAEAQGDRVAARKCFERIVLSRQLEHFPDVAARLERVR